MKKTFIYILLLVFAISCSKDEPNPNDKPITPGPNTEAIQKLRAAAVAGKPATINVADLTFGAADNADLLAAIEELVAMNKAAGSQAMQLKVGEVRKQGSARVQLPNGFANLTMGSKQVEFDGKEHDALPTFSSTGFGMNDTLKISNFLIFLAQIQEIAANRSSSMLPDGERFEIYAVELDGHQAELFNINTGGTIDNYSVFNFIKTGKLIVSKYNNLSSNPSSAIAVYQYFLESLAETSGTITINQDAAFVGIMGFDHKLAAITKTPEFQPKSLPKFISTRPIHVGNSLVLPETDADRMPLGVHEVSNGVFKYGANNTIPLFIETLNTYKELLYFCPPEAWKISDYEKPGKYCIKMPVYDSTNGDMFYERANGDLVAQVAYNEELHGLFFKLTNLMVNYKIQPDQQIAIQVPYYWSNEDQRNPNVVTPGMTARQSWTLLLARMGIDTLSANGDPVVIVLNQNMPTESSRENKVKEIVKNGIQKTTKQEAKLEKQFLQEL